MVNADTNKPMTIVAVCRHSDPTRRVAVTVDGHLTAEAKLEALFVKCEKVLEKLK